MRFIPYNKKLKQYSRDLRNNMTMVEKKIWSFLRQLPVRVNRQKPINNYIADFYCAKAHLIIEIDGESHFTDEGKIYDEERTKILEEYGLKVVRFTNSEVMSNFEGVCDNILKLIDIERF